MARNSASATRLTVVRLGGMADRGLTRVHMPAMRLTVMLLVLQLAYGYDAANGFIQQSGRKCGMIYDSVTVLTANGGDAVDATSCQDACAASTGCNAIATTTGRG